MKFLSSFRWASPLSRLMVYTLLVTLFIVSVTVGILIQFAPPTSAENDQQAPQLQGSEIGTTPTAASDTPAAPPLQQQLYSQVMAATPRYNSTLAGQDSASWNVWTNAGQSCQFTGDGYVSGSPAGQSATFCLSDNLTVDNFAMQVDMKILSGDPGFGGGLMFRYQGPSDKWQGGYWWHIGIDGHYRLATLKGILLENTTSALHTGVNQKNTILAIAQGTNIYLYINGQFVISMNNDYYSQGRIALASMGGSNAVSVQYSNLKIWSL